jgi:agmatinase
VRSGVDLEGIPISDLGDVDTVEKLAETLQRVSTVWSEVVADNKFPIMVGGEHSITKAPFDAFHENICIVNFDAHLDLRNEFLGEHLSHATFMRRIAETIGPDHVMEIGVRAFTKAELDFCHESGVSLVYPSEIREQRPEQIAEKIKRFTSRFENNYVTVDIDVLDPAFAPGVGNPEPDGITTDELLTTVTAALDRKTIGFDLVEVCPPVDTGQTAAVGAKVIFEAIATLSAGGTFTR